ncbi:MAG: D-alanine--D-alanine ligase [Pseudomonadota bacterium]
MHIGITYDLKDDYLEMGYGKEEVAEFDQLATIDAIDTTLKSLGHQTTRIGHIKNLVSRLCKEEKWDLVFNIAEGVKGFGREAQVPAILDAYNIPYTFSDPLVLSLTLHKAMTKRIVRDAKLLTPDFFIIEDIKDIDNFNLNFPIIVKPLAEGTGKGISHLSKVENIDQLKSMAENLLKNFSQPVLAEDFLPGREFTVGIIGTGDEAEAIGTLEILLNQNAEKELYTYSNKENYLDRVEYNLVNDEEARLAMNLALNAWKVLGCRDAGRIDIKSDKYGRPNFLEVNPLAGIHPVVGDLIILCKKVNISYEELISKIIYFAKKRIK